MKRKFALLLTLTLLVSIFAACGSKYAGTGTVQSDVDQGTNLNAEPKKVKIHVVESRDSLVTRNFWDMFIQEFGKEFPQYELKFEDLPSDGPEQFFKTKIAADEFPDVAKVFQPALLIDANIIQELPQELTDMMIDPDFVKVDGKVYTIPQQLGALGIWYNKDIFNEAGVDKKPETWAEFIEACVKIQGIGIEPIGMAAREGWYIGGFYSFLWAPVTYGPKPSWPKLRTEGKVKFNNDLTRRSLEQLKETQPFWQKGAMSATYDQVKGLFFTGEVAMLVNGGIYNAAEINSGELEPEFEVGYLVTPQDRAEDRGINVFQDQSWVINSKAEGEKLQACVDFIKFFYSEDIYEEFLTAQAAMPTIKGFEDFVPAMENETAIKMVEEIRLAMENTRTVAHAHAAQGDNIWPQGTREIVEKIVQELAAGNDDYDQLMDLFDQQWDKGIE